MGEGLRMLWHRKGFKQFLIRLIVLFLVFLSLPIITYPFLEKSRYESGTDPLNYLFGKVYLVDIGASLIVMTLAFILIARNELLQIETCKNKSWQQTGFAAMGILSLSLYLYLRWFSANNAAYVWSSGDITLGFAIAIVMSLATLVISAVCAVFPLDFLKGFIMRFRAKIGISLLFFAGYILTTSLLKSLWFRMSTAVAVCEYHLLNLVGDAFLSLRPPNDPLLGIGGFVVRVGKDCSGIDSMTMFTGLFLLILAVEWHNLNKVRMLAIFLPGLLGMFAVNVFRIFLLMLSGIWISPAFAIGMFHSNAGWLLFVIYFVVFWWFMLPFVKNKGVK